MRGGWNKGIPCPEATKRKISHSEKGKIIPLDVRQKMSEGHKGHIVSEETRVKLRWNHIGQYFTPEHRALLSQNHPDLSGINNPNWQGGRSFEEYGEDFTYELREAVRQRDNWTCQECGKREIDLMAFVKKLDVHHLDRDKQNNKPENLISLCRSCHCVKHGMESDKPAK